MPERDKLLKAIDNQKRMIETIKQAAQEIREAREKAAAEALKTPPPR